MRTTILVFLIVSSITHAIAQQARITGKITGGGNGLAGATVSLLNSKDSSWVKSEITDEAGNFSLKDVAPARYIVSATFIGYTAESKPIDVTGSGDVRCDVELKKDSSSLAEVAVTGKKPFIEASLGKIVVNVEGSPVTAASSVLDLMRRLPGIIVDQDGNISMHGKQGVLVLIDDRPTYLSGTELTEYLKTITAEEAAQIELITQPGAKYDAAGNTGIINIKLRKNKRKGWNGSVTGSYGMGVYFHRNESMMLNYRKNKLNLSFSASDMEAIGFADWKEQLKIIDTQSKATIASKDIHSTAKERFSNTAIKFAADYDLSDKTSIGASMRGTYHPNTNHTYAFSSVNDNSSGTTSYYDVANAEGFIRKDLVTNAYLTEKFSKTNTLDLNFDYLTFSRHASQNLVNTWYDEHMLALADPFIQSNRELSSINVYSFKADQACTFKNGVRMETGLKSSWVSSDNNALYSLYGNGAWVYDTARSNHFLYRENINAAYITLYKSLGSKWELHGGLRAEQTNAMGIQYHGNDVFSKSYLSLFPTVYIGYKSDTNNQFELNYGRRIDRPGYSSLNPFVYYTFQDNYTVGNPRLDPQFTNNVQLKHSYKNTVITQIEFSSTKNVMQNMLQVNDSTKDVYNLERNIASNNFVTLTVIYNKDLFKWWSFNASGTVCYADFTGIIDNVNKTVSWTGYSADMSSRFDFGKGWRAEISAFYVSKGRWSLTSTFEPNSDIEFGVSKKIKDNLLAKFYANDPLYIFRLKSHDISNSYWMYSEYRNATQLFSLSLTWTFGTNQAGGRSHTTDEAKRMNIE